MREVNKWIVAGGCRWAMLGSGKTTKAMHKEGDYFMDDVVEEYVKANQTIADAQAAYSKTLQGFRSAIKNDLSSIDASANKVTAEAAKMQQAYRNAIGTLTAPDMEAAIKNAERLAAALRAISELQSHSITFAVLDKKAA